MKKALAAVVLLLTGLPVACGRGESSEEALTPATLETPPGDRFVQAIAAARCRQAVACGVDLTEVAAIGGSCLEAMQNDTYAELSQCMRPVQREETERCLMAIEETSCEKLGAVQALGNIDGCKAQQLCAD